MVAMLRRYRRKSLLAEPVRRDEQRLLSANLGFFPGLEPERRERLVKIARLLVREKHWEGCGGLKLTDDMKMVIAAQAALLLVGAELDLERDAIFPNVRSILVYPSGFIAPTPRVGPGGVVTEGHANLGEAHHMGAGGPVIVSWRDALAGGLRPDDGRNLVLHEFAHKLDFLDGVIDGTPPLGARERYAQWRRVMTAHFEELRRRTAAGVPSVVDSYGATNPAEFFACATEAFFERGEEMRRVWPELHRIMADYYG